MHFHSLLPFIALTFVPSLAIPTKILEPRVPSQCGQYTSISTGAYTVYANEWGLSMATSGSQCSQINGLSGNTLSWQTTWTWAGGQNDVKSYTNAETSISSKPLSQYTSIKTAWAWRYASSPFFRYHRSTEVFLLPGETFLLT